MPNLCLFCRSANRIRHQQQPSGNSISVNSAQALKKSRNEWRLTKMVLAIFLSFVICYLPITIVKITDPTVNYQGKFYEVSFKKISKRTLIIIYNR